MNNEIENKINKFLLDLKRRNLSKNTIMTYKMNLLMFFRTEEENISKIKRFILENNKPATALLKKNVLIEYYKFLKKRDKVETIKRIKTPPISDLYRVIVSKVEVQKIIDVNFGKNEDLKTRNRSIISLLYLTGIRISELANIKKTDINGNSIFIKGKGQKERIVFFSNEWIEFKNPYSKIYLFSDEHGKKLSEKRLESIVKEMVSRTTLKKKITPHTFRRSFCTNMVKKGANLKIVSKIMGHSKIETTARYLHFTEKDMFREYSKFI